VRTRLPFLVFAGISCAGGAQAADRISDFRIDRSGNGPGKLIVTEAGEPKEIAEAAFRAWIVDGGRQIVYSASGPVKGYEGEGQSLRLYDAATARTREELAAPFEIKDVEEAVATNGRRALIVAMTDSGLGATHVAVVDPARGQVFEARQAKVVERRGDRIVVGFFRESDWERMTEATPLQPFRVRQYDLKDLLKRPLLKRGRSSP
jgi:hypothetical protein